MASCVYPKKIISTWPIQSKVVVSLAKMDILPEITTFETVLQFFSVGHTEFWPRLVLATPISSLKNTNFFQKGCRRFTFIPK